VLVFVVVVVPIKGVLRTPELAWTRAAPLRVPPTFSYGYPSFPELCGTRIPQLDQNVLVLPEEKKQKCLFFFLALPYIRTFRATHWSEGICVTVWGPLTTGVCE